MQCHVMSCIVNTVHAMCFLSTNPQPWNSDATLTVDHQGLSGESGRLWPSGRVKKVLLWRYNRDTMGFIYMIYIYYIYNGLQTNMISFQFTRSLVLLKNNCSFSASAFGQFARRTMPGVGLFTLFGHIWSGSTGHSSYSPVQFQAFKLVPLEFKKWIPVKQHKLADDWSCLPNS